jgi:hypothetical protein
MLIAKYIMLTEHIFEKSNIFQNILFNKNITYSEWIVSQFMQSNMSIVAIHTVLFIKRVTLTMAILIKNIRYFVELNTPPPHTHTRTSKN